MFKHTRSFFSATPIILLLFISCKDEYTLCTLSKDVKFIGGFYQRSGGTEIARAAPLLSVYLTGTTAPIYSQQPNVPTFGLPLNPIADSAKYVITVSAGAQSDTLTITYGSQTSNLSPECGSITYNTISRLTTTTHTIDSVKIADPSVNTSGAVNARIWF